MYNLIYFVYLWIILISLTDAIIIRKVWFDLTHALSTNCYNDQKWDYTYNKCMPVNCVVEYAGIRDYYNNNTYLCEARNNCSGGTIEYIYDNKSNKCVLMPIEKERDELFKFAVARFDILEENDPKCLNGSRDEGGFCVCEEGWTTDPNQEYFEMIYCNMRIEDSEQGRNDDAEHTYEKKSWYSNLTQTEKFMFYATIILSVFVVSTVIIVFIVLKVKARRASNIKSCVDKVQSQSRLNEYDGEKRSTNIDSLRYKWEKEDNEDYTPGIIIHHQKPAITMPKQTLTGFSASFQQPQAPSFDMSQLMTPMPYNFNKPSPLFSQFQPLANNNINKPLVGNTQSSFNHAIQRPPTIVPNSILNYENGTKQSHVIIPPDDHQTYINQSHTSTGFVVRNFTPTHNDELELRMGDYIINITPDIEEPNYSYGESSQTRKRGLFPTTFVKIRST